MTPVLAAIPVDTLIWIVLLLIGAIGSIASNAKKAAAVRRPTPAASPTPPQSVVVSVLQPPSPAAPATPPPIIVPRPRPVASQPPKPAAPVPPPVAAHGTSAFRGMFERGNLARAVIASEVLGPPKSLRE